MFMNHVISYLRIIHLTKKNMFNIDKIHKTSIKVIQKVRLGGGHDD